MIDNSYKPLSETVLYDYNHLLVTQYNTVELLEGTFSYYQSLFIESIAMFWGLKKLVSTINDLNYDNLRCFIHTDNSQLFSMFPNFHRVGKLRNHTKELVDLLLEIRNFTLNIRRVSDSITYYFTTIKESDNMIIADCLSRVKLHSGCYENVEPFHV